MFRFSVHQAHAIQHSLQDFGKLTLAVLFLGSAIGIVPHSSQAWNSLQVQRIQQPSAKFMGTGAKPPASIDKSNFFNI